VAAIVEDCPLLLESGVDASCDALVFVDSDFEARLARVARKRGWDRAELERRESLQAALDTKASRADYVVWNSSGEHERLEQVRLVLSSILQKYGVTR
jgi:dephospho-CoA kinase